MRGRGGLGDNKAKPKAAFSSKKSRSFNGPASNVFQRLSRPKAAGLATLVATAAAGGGGVVGGGNEVVRSEVSSKLPFMSSVWGGGGGGSSIGQQSYSTEALGGDQRFRPSPQQQARVQPRANNLRASSLGSLVKAAATISTSSIRYNTVARTRRVNGKGRPSPGVGQQPRRPWPPLAQRSHNVRIRPPAGKERTGMAEEPRGGKTGAKAKTKTKSAADVFTRLSRPRAGR